MSQAKPKTATKTKRGTTTRKPRRVNKAKRDLASGHVDFRAGIGHIAEAKKVSMTKIAKDELNSILNILGLKLAHCAMKFVVAQKMKTLKKSHLDGAAKILLSDNLYSSVSREGLTKFMNKPKLSPNKGLVAEIIKNTQISSKRSDKLIRMYAKGINVSALVRHMLAHILDEIATELIVLAGNHVIENKKERVKTRDLFTVIHYDQDLHELIFKKLKITMAGSGVAQRIPQAYLPEAGKPMPRKAGKTITKIRNQQEQSQCFNISQAPFHRLVKEHLDQAHGNSAENIKLSKSARVALQYFVEAQTVKLLHGANANALHVPRTVVQKKDIDLELMKQHHFRK